MQTLTTIADTLPGAPAASSAPGVFAVPVGLSVPESALVILGVLEHLSMERDLDRLRATTLRVLAELSGAEQVAMFIWVDDRFLPLLVVGPDGMPQNVDADGEWPLPPEYVTRAHAGLDAGAVGVPSIMLDERTIAHGVRNARSLAAIITLRYANAAATRPWWIGSVLTAFQNHVNLINDAECDTLTGLFNRKTFEGRFNGVLAIQRAMHNNPGFGTGERRAARPGEHHWIAVADIDHFKNINDRFGHLYGDEVLILLSRIMMRSFRMEDRLFRFGGEEFVIVLSPCSPSNAQMVLERFRTAIEKYDFPQVGRVTISMGYTRIRSDDLPPVAVGRGDEALYYAKRNGRNRVCSYEQLAEAGDVKSTAPDSEFTLF
jgi:diguanylate cyclase (GGDEF)-like protein